MSGTNMNETYFKSRIPKKKRSVRSYVDKEFSVDDSHKDSKKSSSKRNYFEDTASLLGSNQVAPWLRPYDQPNITPNTSPETNYGMDKKRAPKAAVLIFICFLVFSGVEIGFNKKELIDSISERPLGDLLRGQNTPAKDDNSDPASSLLGQKNITDSESFENENNGTNFSLKESDLAQPNLDVHGKPIVIPSELSYIANINEPLSQNEIALFWHVPRSGGSTIKDIAAFCLDLTQASEVGIILDPNAATYEQTVMIIDPNTGAKFINVDTTTLPGLERAHATNVAADPNVDLIVSPYLYDCAKLFNYVNRGRMFTLFRHPIERAVSMYYYIKNDPSFAQQVGDTLERYAKSEFVENNWMTRFLSNKMGGELTQDDEAIAKEVLRTKCIIGLLKKKDESLRRFASFFGWNSPSTTRSEACQEKLLTWNWSGKNKHPTIEKQSEAWKLLEEHNTFDIRLYEYAEALFEYQTDVFH